MKNLQIIALFLGLVAISAFKLPAGGQNTLTIRGNGDPQACFLTLSVSLTASQIIFSEKVNNSNWDCTYQNLSFSSMFRSDYSLTGSVDLLPTNDTTIYTGTLDLGNVSLYDGTACINYGFQPLLNRYGNLCRFKYGDVLFSILFYTRKNGTIDTNWDHLLFPIYGSTKTVVQSGQYVTVSSNDSFPHFVGQLYSQCHGWSTQITDLQNPLYVTGTNYVSNEVSLEDYFKFFLVYSVIVRKKNAPANQYINNFVGYFAFFLPPDGNCSNTLMKYEDIIPDLTYCKDGCDVSFLMLSSSLYVLQTSGFTSVPPNLRRD